MKIVFNGLLEKKSGGCNCKKSASEYGYVRTRMFILPSGRTKTFRVGKVEEVSEQDGKFLLAYKPIDVNGARREIFTKVEG